MSETMSNVDLLGSKTFRGGSSMSSRGRIGLQIEADFSMHAFVHVLAGELKRGIARMFQQRINRSKKNNQTALTPAIS